MITPRKFRKKPIPVEMVQLTNTNGEEVVAWVGGARHAYYCGGTPFRRPSLTLLTMEGSLKVGIGDWVVRGVAGEHYPIADSVKRATYEEAE